MQTNIQQPAPMVDRDTAENMLENMWTAAALEPEYPATTHKVSKLLRAGGGFDCTPELLETWARSGSVVDVTITADGFRWNPEHIIQAGGLLNASRRWLLRSPHIAKMTAIELAELQARQVGETVFEGIDQVDCRALVGVIAGENTDHETRGVLCRALLTKLEMAGIA